MTRALDIPRLLDLYNEVWDAEHPYVRKPGRWIASSLGYCARRNVFERGGLARAPIDAKTLRTFAWGRFLHTQIRNVLDEFGVLVNEEIELDDAELQVVGHGDAIVGGQPLVPDLSEVFPRALYDALKEIFGQPPYPFAWHEYKSVNSKGMQRLYNEARKAEADGRPVEGYHHHQIQLATYHLLAHRNPEQVVSKDGLLVEMPELWQIVCVGKDAWGVQTFDVNEKNVEEAHERILWLNDHWKDEQLPPCECETWMRSYCAFPDGEGGCCPEDLADQVDWSR